MYLHLERSRGGVPRPSPGRYGGGYQRPGNQWSGEYGRRPSRPYDRGTHGKWQQYPVEPAPPRPNRYGRPGNRPNPQDSWGYPSPYDSNNGRPSPIISEAGPQPRPNGNGNSDIWNFLCGLFGELDQPNKADPYNEDTQVVTIDWQVGYFCML